jgi:nicotinate-nucleotide--dimethylbenzimidazole phosphoribosyltransferase
MTPDELNKALAAISAPDRAIEAEVQSRWDALTKPPHSLGKLEDVISKLGGIQGRLFPEIRRRTALCFAADHGVVAEGVSPSSQVVTTEMVKNFLNGGAAISVLCRSCRCDLKVVDTGMIHPLDHPDIIQMPVARGTANMRRRRAMSEDQMYRALGIGYNLARKEIEAGAQLLISGEMGVGNTTAASAIYAAVTGMEPEGITGKGAGLPADRVGHKADVIRESLKLHNPDPRDPRDVLSAVGGFELAAMCGLMLAGAVNNCAVVVDGFIAGASAVLAMLFHPGVRDYLIFSHSSGEAGFDEVCRSFSIDPLVDLNMKLGEGTGAVMILPLLDNALDCYREMATFAEAGVTEIDI